MLAFRSVSRCELCERSRDPMCDRVREDSQRLVMELAQLAACSGRTLPEADLVLDCHSFWRAHRSRG